MAFPLELTLCERALGGRNAPTIASAGGGGRLGVRQGAERVAQHAGQLRRAVVVSGARFAQHAGQLHPVPGRPARQTVVLPSVLGKPTIAGALASEYDLPWHPIERVALAGPVLSEGHGALTWVRGSGRG